MHLKFTVERVSAWNEYEYGPCGSSGSARQWPTGFHRGARSESQKMWVKNRRTREFMIFVIGFSVGYALALASFVYVLNVRLKTGMKPEFPIPDSALDEQLRALQLHSPWHDNEVGAHQVCNTSECVHAAYHLLFGINQAANPCDDFYEFSCGNWIKHYKDQMFPSNSHYEEMSTSEDALVEDILMRPPDSYEFQPMKVGSTFFHQCVSEGSDDVDSVVNLTTKLGGWPSLEGDNWNEDDFDLVTALAFIRRQYHSSVLVDVNLAPHGVNDTVNVLKLSVPGFTSEDQFKNETFMTAHKSLYNKVLSELTGVTDWSEDQEEDADEILQLEKALAQAVTVPDENANVSNTQETFTVAEFQEYFDESLNWLHKPVSNNSISWKRLLNKIFSTSGAQINDDELLIVADLGYFTRMVQILDATPKRTIANYVLWSMASGLLPEASTKMEPLICQPVDLKSRESYCFGLTMPVFSIGIMHEYLKTKSNLEARAVVEQMSANLQETFFEILENNNWLSDAATLAAQKKLGALKTFIGYPSWLLNTTEIESRFEGLHVGSNFIETLGNLGVWATHKQSEELGKSPSSRGRDEPWFVLRKLAASFSKFDGYHITLPSTVQAFYLESSNFLVLTMGFIQPHHFYNNVPSYINYGRLGVVIGHEIIHGYDVSSKNVDENGQNDDESWTDEDEEQYEEKSNCFRDQYNNFEVLPGVYLNGSGGLDENISDNSGMKIAYLTFKKECTRAGDDYERLPGFEKLSVEQLFFLSYGSLWCEHENEAIQKLSVQRDTHSPGKYRINGVLQNSPEFADAWNCPAGVPMNPVKKCTLW